MNNKGFVLVLIFLAELITTISAETTFFDNPGDSFMISSSSATKNGAITSNAIIEVEPGYASCKYNWNCTNWSECLPNRTQTRNCTNIGTCFNSYNPPKIKKGCLLSLSGIDISNRTIKNNIVLAYSALILGILLIIIYLSKKYFWKLFKKHKLNSST